MPYINLKNLLKLPNPNYLTVLLLVRGNVKKDYSNDIAKVIQSDCDLEYLLENGYIKIIKGKKGQSEFERLRIDKKGTKFLNSLDEPEITEDDKKMFDYLCEMYLKHEDEERHIGNKKKTLLYCAEFRQILDLGIYQMYWLCWFFLQEYSYTKRLEYIFFNSNKHRYGTFKGNLDDSALYQFYNERKRDVVKLWTNKISIKNRE